MRRAVLLLIAIVLLACNAKAADLGADIAAELGLDDARSLIPDSLDGTDIDFSPTGTPSENGLDINKMLKTLLLYVFDALQDEIAFVFIMLALLVVSSVVMSLTGSSRPAMMTAVRFAVSAVVASVLISHIEGAFSRATEFISSVSDMMTGLLPFFGSISLVGGELTSSAVQRAILLTAVNVLQNVIPTVVIPISRTVMALSIAGYISDLNLGAISEFISSISSKTVSIGCGIMCAILYFQNTVSAVTDSLALRSVKLMAGSFVPVVGSFVSEASGTLISGVRLVKTTFGVFAIAVLVYMSARPIINFLTVKLSLRFSAVIAKLLGCDREARVMSEMTAVYNILSAVMIASACFFIFFVAVFLKSEVG